jgi:sporulation protein YlmC with PRC-barrel domain
MTIKIRKAYQSKNVVGMVVKNSDKQVLGNIEEIVVDIESGTIAYAVLSFDGFFGFIEKFFAIPWNEFSLTHDEAESYFILDTDRDKLSALPGFNKKDWPDMANSDWDAELDQLYQSDDEW